MNLRTVKKRRTLIKFDMDLIDGLFSITKGKEVMWVTDSYDSALKYFNYLIAV